MQNRKRIFLEGNIGAGKSTVGKVLQASGAFDFIEEPVDEWKTRFAANMLEVFYRDMQRWAFTFQVVTLITRVKTWPEIAARTGHPRVVLERSIYTDRHVFAPTLHRLGAISDAEWQVYCGLWDFLTSHHDMEPDCILYLRTPAAVCLERVHVRDRNEESGLTLSYLQQLEALHDAWLLAHPRVLVLDGTQRWTAGQVLELASGIL